MNSFHRPNERGEGVISTAIAVLVIALLGVVLWLAFRGLIGDVADKTQSEIDKIGNVIVWTP